MTGDNSITNPPTPKLRRDKSKKGRKHESREKAESSRLKAERELGS